MTMPNVTRSPQISIEIPLDGNPKIEVLGASGPGCKQLTEALERALGKVVSEQQKPEFFRAANQPQQQHQGR